LKTKEKEATDRLLRKITSIEPVLSLGSTISTGLTDISWSFLTFSVDTVIGVYFLFQNEVDGNPVTDERG
jgi:hypothetical protein